MKLKTSLNQKLVVPIVCAYVLIVALLVVSEYRSSTGESMGFLRERIVQLSDVVQYGTMSLMLQDQCDSVPEFLRNSGATIQGELTIFDPRNGALLLSADHPDARGSTTDRDFELYQAYRGSRPVTISENDESQMVRFLPLTNASSCRACHRSESALLGVIKVRQNLTGSLRDARRQMLKRIVVSTIGITLFALFFSYVVMRLINDPLRKVMQTVRRIEDGDLDSRVPVERDDIIGELAEKINAMTEKRKAAALELQRCHDLQVMRASQMASIGEMAACIAHDIKNPLACMSGALQVIDGEMNETDENKPIIREVIDQIGRIDQSVKKILQYAKPGAERAVPVDIDEILGHSLALIDRYARGKNVQVTFARGDGEKRVQGEAQSLQQLFFNVCLNGIEAIEGPGSLAVSSTLREGGVDGREGRRVEVAIRDSGCGIDESDLGLIFKPLFTTKPAGTGLGLSISAETVERHHGAIDVTSESGKGTTFRIFFPAATG